MTTAVRARLARGIGANAFGQALSIAIQLASLPLFLGRWDLPTYGIWLMLSALPGYLSMADAGMVTAAGNRMTMAVGRGDVAQARTVFHSATVFVTGVCVAAGALLAAGLAWLPLPGLLQPPGAALAVGCLGAGVLVAFWGGLAHQLVRATGRNAQGEMATHLVRLAEWLGQLGGLFTFGSLLSTALGGLLMRVVGTAIAARLARRGSGSIDWGFARADAAVLRGLWRPAAGFMLIPAANALSLQGMTLLVGHLLGPAAVAVFNTYRTLARVVVQATSAFSFALWPEFARAYGAEGARGVAPLYHRARRTGLWIAAVAVAAVGLGSPWLLALWTHGKIEFLLAPMGAMLAYATVASATHVPRVLLLSTSRHEGLVWAGIASAVAGLLVASQLTSWSGLLGAALAMALADALAGAAALRGADRLLREPAA
ncbi:MAG: lipopolysaccharide biosynthesis protein [Aquincola tertiaricarbonis]|uniref:lipopolysaccharide biosynthesis protein n=1 Tax=Aquincola sp. J276 TaxID=2898432 RepID=UPI0021518ECA|nr:hypothetical protein [Aquincola sp. J276]MCR5865811.1 hypothetical protein [Aquincola sp. J276]